VEEEACCCVLFVLRFASSQHPAHPAPRPTPRDHDRGEVCVRGPTIFQGYYKDEAQVGLGLGLGLGVRVGLGWVRA